MKFNGWVLCVLGPGIGLAVWGSAVQMEAATAAPAISGVAVMTPNVARYDKFEVQFDVTSVAANLDLPFDPAPPVGLGPGLGVSVEAIFSPDNWATVITQPAFLYQPYTLTQRDGQDHLSPSGPPKWTVRFAPQQAGTWRYRLRAQDAGGAAIYPASGALTFNVGAASSNPYRQRGFLRVSPRDARYFEFQNGEPFVGVGFNDGFVSASAVEAKLQKYEQYKMNLMRVWLSGAGINGSQWTSWASPFLQDDGYLPGVDYDIQNTFGGGDVALRLDNANRCFFDGWRQEGVPVEPNQVYRLEARVRLNNVTGPSGAGVYGFVVKQGGWLGTECEKAGAGTLVTTPIAGSTGWITVTGSYTTTSNQYWLGNLYLARQNAMGGEVYIDRVTLWRADDSARVNVLHEPEANHHLHFEPLNAAKWDRYIESAEQHGVYLKLVIDEKDEWIRSRMNAQGAMTDVHNDDNFYAAPGLKVHWLEQAWWRYLIARWGYSTAIHSFEYVNEGDPYSGRHHEAANAFARYVHQNDPSRHMVTTSFWHSFPNSEFWSNPDLSDVDYADLHAYISTGWGQTASFVEASKIETRSPYVHSGGAAVHVAGTDHADYAITPRGLVIHGPGEWIVRYWMKASNFASACSSGSTGGMQRVRWLVDGGPYWGGQAGVAPFNAEGKDFICTSPAGTFDWQPFSSDRDREGALIPAAYRLMLSDSGPHEISLRIENPSGTGGDAWIDDVELVSPSGEVAPVVGQFDVTPMDEDTAWGTYAYSLLLGGGSPVGARKPLVRGETGVDSPNQQDWNRDLNKDMAGIWLHNNVWGQINPGGMYDLMWWAAETIDQNAGTGRYTHIYTNFLTFQNFMQGVPLNNGLYRDARAQGSNPDLRVWGQRDDVNGRMHLWAQNTQHTWKRVVAGVAIPPVSGVITLRDVVSGTYRVTWWDTYQVGNPVFLTQTLPASGTLSLALPAPLASDVGIKIERVEGVAWKRVFLPLVLR